MGDLVQHFRYQIAPRGLGGRRLAAVFSPGFAYVALPAKGLAAVWFVGILPGVDMLRHNVIALQPPSTATGAASVAVAAEHGAPGCLPAAAVKVYVIAAHVLICDSDFPRSSCPQGRPSGPVVPLRDRSTLVFGSVQPRTS